MRSRSCQRARKPCRANPLERIVNKSVHYPPRGASKLVVGFVLSFTGIGAAVIALMITRVVSAQVGILMLVMSVGMHLGFGVLVAVHRLIDRLE